MSHPGLKVGVLKAFHRNPGETLSVRMLRAVAKPDGGNVTRDDVIAVCRELVEEGVNAVVRRSPDRHFKLVCYPRLYSDYEETDHDNLLRNH